MQEYARTVFFVPANGKGERVSPLGIKPFLQIGGKLALARVLAMAPKNVPCEVGLPFRPENVPNMEFDRPWFIRHMPPTLGQAHTINLWMLRNSIVALYEWVIISNCDNEIDAESVVQGLEIVAKLELDGAVFIFKPRNRSDARFSYVTLNCNQIETIVEKKPISEHAVAGVYIFRTIKLLQALNPQMTKAQPIVNHSDEYLSAAIQRMVSKGDQIWGLSCKHYAGWNDLEQIEEVNNHIEQYRG